MRLMIISYLDSSLTNVDFGSEVFSESDIRVVLFLKDFLQLL